MYAGESILQHRKMRIINLRNVCPSAQKNLKNVEINRTVLFPNWLFNWLFKGYQGLIGFNPKNGWSWPAPRVIRKRSQKGCVGADRPYVYNLQSTYSEIG